jgi:hypothetical protein
MASGSVVTITPGDMKAFVYASGEWRGMP